MCPYNLILNPLIWQYFLLRSASCGWPGPRHGRIARHTVQHALIVIRGSMMTIDNRPAMVAVEAVCGGG